VNGAHSQRTSGRFRRPGELPLEPLKRDIDYGGSRGYGRDLGEARCGEKKGGKLVVREGRFGSFISCSRYPKCKFIKQDEAEEAKKRTGVSCPICKKGEITERRGRFGIFFSCSNYPNCKFNMKSRPTGNTCKLCGSLMMEGTKTIPERCSNKTCLNHNPHKLNK
jgi:DNA topoisomerase-1